MQLTGALEVFRVQDVLGLVARKPGQWKITLRDGPYGRAGFIGVRDHRIVSISANTAHQDLARRLVIEGAIGTTGLAQALRHASDKGLGLVRALVDSDTVDPVVIPPTIRAHTVASLASLSHWRAGAFEADIVGVLPDDVEVGFPLEELSADVVGLLKRWRPASDMLGGPGTVIAAYPGSVPQRLRGLHSLIDGHRTVGELTEASGHGDVGTIVDLADLVDAHCAVPITGEMGALEQRLAMLAALEHPDASRSRPAQPNLSVIPGGQTDEPVEQPDDDDLLAALLRGVRGV